MASGAKARRSPSSGSTGDSVGSPKLIPQPHGGALSRGGRKPGARNKVRELLPLDVVDRSLAGLVTIDE